MTAEGSFKNNVRNLPDQGFPPREHKQRSEYNGLGFRGILGLHWGLYSDNRKENGRYYSIVFKYELDTTWARRKR